MLDGISNSIETIMLFAITKTPFYPVTLPLFPLKPAILCIRHLRSPSPWFKRPPHLHQLPVLLCPVFRIHRPKCPHSPENVLPSDSPQQRPYVQNNPKINIRLHAPAPLCPQTPLSSPVFPVLSGAHRDGENSQPSSLSGSPSFYTSLAADDKSSRLPLTFPGRSL